MQDTNPADALGPSPFHRTIMMKLVSAVDCFSRQMQSKTLVLQGRNSIVRGACLDASIALAASGKHILFYYKGNCNQKDFIFSLGIFK